MMNFCPKVIKLGDIIDFIETQLDIHKISADANMKSYFLGKQLSQWINNDLLSYIDAINDYVNPFCYNYKCKKTIILTSMDSLQLDYGRDAFFDKSGIQRLKDNYMLSCENSPQERFEYIATQVGTNKKHSQYLYDISSKHWLSYSTPILALGKTRHGLPISCYLSYLPDTSEGLLTTLGEVNELSMLGGGVGIGIGLRSADDGSVGCLPHLKTYDSCSLAYRQDRVRRGAYAAYLPIDHPDIIEFIEMRKSTGDHNIRCLNMHHGICITDKFMKQIEECTLNEMSNTVWKLVDPHTLKTKKEVDIRDLWQRILETRLRTGEPYICFIDTCNTYMNPYQKKLGLKINQSNLCTEIILPTDKDRTAICCLSSVNLEYYDDWKNDDYFFLAILEMLDNVLNIFINKIISNPRLNRIFNSVSKERSIGLGVLGFHAYLQKHNIAFESEDARKINTEIFSKLKEQVDKANSELGKRRGSPSDIEGSGNRFSYCIAIAPNASTSIIMGNTSPGIEPFRANAYRQDTISGSYLTKNKFLTSLLNQKYPDGHDTRRTDHIWNSIITNNGSIQHMDIFSDVEKNVFKTAFEIDQHWILEHASDRQPFIDQSQSLNLFLKPTINIKELFDLHLYAWKAGLKTLYYCRSTRLDSDRPQISECKSCQ